MTIDTTRFGPVEIDPEAIITLPKGLIGFPTAKRFALLEYKPGHPFRWLQSLDDPSLAFLVMDPLGFFPDYEVELTDEDARSLKLKDPKDALVLTTISVRQSPLTLTTNLLGPVVIGLKTRKAMQVVLDADRYSTRHPLPINPSAAQQPVMQSAA